MKTNKRNVNFTHRYYQSHQNCPVGYNYATCFKNALAFKNGALNNTD